MTGVRSPSTRPGLGAPVTRGGFPHSEIRGSTLVRSSPRLIAAYHVLHRLSAPRHPPDALQALDRSLARCPCGRPRRAAHAHGLERPVSFSGSVASTRARGQRPPKGPNRSSLFTMSMSALGLGRGPLAGSAAEACRALRGSHGEKGKRGRRCPACGARGAARVFQEIRDGCPRAPMRDRP